VNLFFLVEGRRTEPRVYNSWVKHTFPQLRRVKYAVDADTDCYCIFSGNGFPAYRRRLRSALEEIGDHPAIDHFFLCVDSEETNYEKRVAEEQRVMAELAEETSLFEKNPRVELHLIVQRCCIETWFLGNRKMMNEMPTSSALAEMKRFYDVCENDPELMGKPDGYITRMSYHLAYLKEMLREQRKNYSKELPGVVKERDYLDALRERCTTTGHLGSLSALLSVWDRLAGTMIAK